MIALSKTVMGNVTQNNTIALGLTAVFLVTTIIGTGLWPIYPRRHRRNRAGDR